MPEKKGSIIKRIFPEKDCDVKFVEFMETSFVDRNGIHKQWQWFRRKGNTQFVSIASIINNGDCDRIVAIKEFRHSISDYEYGLPAGLIENGLTLEETLEKEIKEETGLVLKKILLISPPLLTSVGVTNETGSLAFIEVTGTPSQEFLEPTEDIETFLLDREEAGQWLDAAEKGEIKMGEKCWFVFSLFTRRIPTEFI